MISYIECNKVSHETFGNLIFKKKNKKVKLCDNFIALDTETSHNHNFDNPIGWIYQWAFRLCNVVVYGRTVRELVNCLYNIQNFYALGDDKKIVIYVHNLSYDITYLHRFLELVFRQKAKILAIKPHKILTYQIGGLEFRCSYLLSNMSLDKWAQKLETEHQKLVGTVDYDIVRYPWTVLTQTDWNYMFGDVLTLYDCIITQMTHDNDNIYTIPLTSTGYVRRDVRNATRTDKNYRKWFLDTRLNVATYSLAKRAFAGAYTHGNRFYSGKTIKRRIGHFDFKSQYPSVQMLEYFPVGKLIFYYKFNKDKPLELSKFKQICKEYCVLSQVFFVNGKLKKGITAPYLQISKMIGDYTLYDDRGGKAHDNGRCINFKGIATLAVTELDFDIITSQYDFDNIIIGNTYISKRGYIQNCIKNVINDYFYVKETSEKGYFRDKTKNKLNGIYGMTATDIIRELIYIDDDFNYLTEEQDIATALDKYYKSYNSFNNYLYGVWTTAHARHWLISMISKVVGYDKYIYSDTDSIFFIYDDDVIKRIETYNNYIISVNKNLDYGVTNKSGDISYYGTFEDEAEDEGIITEFRFLHAKCYAFVANNNLNVTIAGVAKNGRNNVTSAEELKNIDNLQSGYIFDFCGGTRAIYTGDKITSIEVGDNLLEYASACIITNVTKTLNGLDVYTEYDVE